MTELLSHARKLRKHQTDAENLLWKYLRNRNICGKKFRRQHPLSQYIVDFVCLDEKLIIEVDGGQHSEQEAYDARRTKHLEQLGFKVLRFWNNQVLTETTAVLDSIFSALNSAPSPQPSPSRERGLQAPASTRDYQ